MKKIVIGAFLVLITSVIILCISNIGSTKAATTTLAQTVINLSQGTSYTAGNGNGVYYTNSHEYRYVGGEVNNYVSFNNDLYRIIGVFDSNTTGVNANLVKLIRARKLATSSWGVYNTTASSGTYSSYKNDWTGNTTGVKANANVLLNEYFLNGTDTSLTYGDCENWTYGYNSNTYKTKNCTNIKGYGIKSSTVRNFIQPVTWYMYGYTGNRLAKANWYKCERNNYTNCKSGNSGGYTGTVTASIGLLYISDYMYASGYVASNNTNTYGSSANLMNLNWLYNGYEWTMSPVSGGSTNVFSIAYGTVTSNYSYNGYGIRPTFYLKANVYVTGGTGTFSNPYTIDCDDCNS